MDAIKIYLDNVFAAFPQTERVRALKREMLAGMEEKYQELKQEGKSEHEAVGSVIANFGSIDEIAKELGIEQNKTEPDDVMPVSREQAFDYLASMKKSGFWIGIGVWLILTGVSTLIFTSELSDMLQGEGMLNATGVFILFLVIAAAVVIFIVNGFSLYRFEAYTKNTLRLDAQTRVELEQLSNRFMACFIAQIAIGVAMILLGVGTMVVLFEIAGFNNQSLPPALLLFTVGFAVFLFITAGMNKSAFDILLGKGDYVNKMKNNKAERIIGTAASVYWPIMTAIYLLWSFIGNNWDISWVIWPVAGVLFGAFAGGVSTWLGNK